MTYGLEELISDLCSNNVPPDDSIFAYLSKTDTVALKNLLGRLERVRTLDHASLAAARRLYNSQPGAPRQHVAFAQKSVLGVKTRATGMLLERIVRLVCKGCRVFTTVTNLHSSTAEIDLLVHLGPMASAIPAFRDAGTHLIGEAKCYASGFKQEWVNELTGLMQQHQCSHSLLFVASPSKILPVSHRHGMHIHSVGGRHVVPFGLKQLKQVADGENFLSVLSHQYVRVRMGAVDLSI